MRAGSELRKVGRGMKIKRGFLHVILTHFSHLTYEREGF